MAAFALVTAVLAVVDQRTLVGAPLWFKPMKFSISIALFALALAWMLGQLRERALRRTGWAIVTGLVLEMVIIVGQAARGQKSHYNTDDLLGGALFSIMGATITVVWFLTLAIALRFLREPGRDRAMALAIRLGLLVSLVGMAVGFLLARGGGHAVGVPDGGPGLFFVGWSTTGGDLRISHFVGLHALQVLPLLAALLAHRSVVEAMRTRIVWSVAVGYLGVVLLLIWQALRAQPLFAPDALTLGALGVVALAALAVLRPGRRAIVHA
jgi:hydrogenase-4 membrane subunit HyfE